MAIAAMQEKVAVGCEVVAGITLDDHWKVLRTQQETGTPYMLLENVWDYHFDPQTNVIDVHVSRLRAKIDKSFDTPLLHTVRGAGYMIRDGAR